MVITTKAIFLCKHKVLARLDLQFRAVEPVHALFEGRLHVLCLGLDRHCFLADDLQVNLQIQF